MFGAQFYNERTSWDEIKSVLEVMEAGDWTSVYTYDHFGKMDLTPLPSWYVVYRDNGSVGVDGVGLGIMGNAFKPFKTDS